MVNFQKSDDRGDREYDYVISAEYKLVAKKLSTDIRTAV